jgi:hypothetical protein
LSNEYVKLSQGQKAKIAKRAENYLTGFGLILPDANESEEAHKQLVAELDEYYKTGKIKRAKMRSR